MRSTFSLYYSFREYHEDQLQLITSIEDILVPKEDGADDHATAYERKQKRTIKILTMVTLVTNIVCFTLSPTLFIY